MITQSDNKGPFAPRNPKWKLKDIMTTGKPEEKPCAACRFWLFFEHERTERCGIKGCYEKNKFIPFDPSNPKHYETASTKSQHAKN